jgi:hypothetical protein
MGEDIYSRRKYVKEFFNHFETLSIKKAIPVEISYQYSMDDLPNQSVAYGPLEINNLVKTIIGLEAIKENGKVSIVAQPEYDFLFKFLTLEGINWQDLAIDHIICMENSMQDDNSHYNLGCINAMMPLLVTGCKYNPMCYYDNIKAHFNSTTLMPYIILTSESIVNISYDISYATVSHFKPYLALYNQIFEDLKQKSVPMAVILHSPFEQISHYLKFISSYGNTDYHFSYAPCLVYFATDEMCHKYVTHLLPEREVFISLVIQHLNDFRKALPLHTVETIYFSEEGLDRFLDTGLLSEIPAQFYSPLNISDRYRLLKYFYDAAIAGICQPLIINSKKLTIPVDLITCTCNDNAVSFVYNSQDHDSTALVITEKSIAFWLNDFLGYLKNSSMIFSKEETIALLEDRLLHAPKDPQNSQITLLLASSSR